MGLKRSGTSAVRLLLQKGAKVIGTDSDPFLKMDAASFRSDQVTLALGEHRDPDFLTADLIVVSPGIPTTHPILKRSRHAGVSVMGELELAAAFLDNEKILAITGTNGKSTTTELLGAIMRESGKKTFVGGNLGTPVSEAVLNAPSGGWDIFVLEVSSFQLETLVTFRPKIAALLNITPDHGERYASLQDYIAAKFELFRNQTSDDYALLNWDDPLIRQSPFRIRSKTIWFSQRESLQEGICLDGRYLRFKYGLSEFKLGPVELFLLKGKHNIENIMVASAIALLNGIPPATIQSVLGRFGGLEHRMERVRIIRGVTYINDSKATNVGAVIRSLESTDPPIVLIAGGKEKGDGFASLGALVREKVKLLLLIGEAKERMKRDLEGLTRIEEAPTLEAAVQKASVMSGDGDTVLLSPACASYDMFKDYSERGARFKKAVEAIP